MAAFNPTPTPTQDPNYLRYSRGIDAGKSMPGNDALGTAIANVGNLALNAVGAMDEGNKTRIDEDARERVDAINSEQGVDKAVESVAEGNGIFRATGNSVTATAPTGATKDLIEKQAQRLESERQAFKAGKRSTSYVLANTESAVRQVRANFPGYDEYIDQRFAQLGANTASKLAASHRADLAAAETVGASNENRLQARFDHFAKYLSQDQQAAVQANPALRGKAILAGQLEESRRMDISRQTAEVGLANSTRELQQKQGMGVVSTMGDSLFAKLIKQGQEAELIQSITRKRQADPNYVVKAEEAMQLAQAIQRFRSNAIEEYTRSLHDTNETLKPGASQVESTQSLHQLVGADNAAKGLKAFTDRIDNHTQAFTTNDTGVLKAAETFANMQVSDSLRELVRNNPNFSAYIAMGKFEGLKGILAAAMTAQAGGTLLGREASALVRYFQEGTQARGLVFGQRGAPSTSMVADMTAVSRIKAFTDDPQALNAYYNTVLEDVASNLNNERLAKEEPAAFLARVNHFIAEGGVIREIGDPVKKSEWFMKTFTSKSIELMKKATVADPAAWAAVQRVAEDVAADLLSRPSETIRDARKDAMARVVPWFNVETNRLDTRVGPGVKQAPGSVPSNSERQAQAAAQREMTYATGVVNAFMDRMEPMFGKMDAVRQQELLQRVLRLNMDAQYDPSMLDGLIALVKTGVKKATGLFEKDITLGDRLLQENPR